MTIGLLWMLAVLPTGGSPQAPFTEEAASRGIGYVFGSDNSTFGHGVCFCDLDRDGDPDIVLIGAADGHVGVYENDGSGFFTDRSATSNILPMNKASGISAADYDGDQDLDLYFTVHGSSNVLMRNEGNLTFLNVTRNAGVGDAGWGQGSAWGDYDKDGWLDLYVANRTRLGEIPNRLFRNLGDGTFEEVAQNLGVSEEEDRLTFMATFVDYDRDQNLDLYLCTDKGMECIEASNHLYQNQGAGFVEVTEEAGAEACVGCMGTGIGDFDANGYLDFYCSNVPLGNVLLLNQGDGTFVDSAAEAGVASYLLGWGNLIFDFDNDTHQDIYVCNFGTNRLYDNNQSWPCDDVASGLGVAFTENSYTVAAADLEGDGDRDLLVHNLGSPPHLFVNHEGDSRHWTSIALDAPAPNRHGIGATVFVTAEGVTQLAQVHAGIGFKSMSALDVHFGLDDATVIDRVRVLWPSGGMTVRENLPVNQRLVISPDQPVNKDPHALPLTGN